ncbi:MAG: hypothetical protein SNJ77_06580, partial [Cytophagales bacterium]
MEVESSKYRVHGLTGSIAVHLFLLLILFFMVIGMPDPPLSERGGGGIELNYGTDEAGFGDNQTLEQAGDNTQITEASSSSSQTTSDFSNSDESNQSNQSLTEDNPESITLNETKTEKTKSNKSV